LNPTLLIPDDIPSLFFFFYVDIRTVLIVYFTGLVYLNLLRTVVLDQVLDCDQACLSFFAYELSFVAFLSLFSEGTTSTVKPHFYQNVILHPYINCCLVLPVQMFYETLYLAMIIDKPSRIPSLTDIMADDQNSKSVRVLRASIQQFKDDTEVDLVLHPFLSGTSSSESLFMILDDHLKACKSYSKQKSRIRSVLNPTIDCIERIVCLIGGRAVAVSDSSRFANTAFTATFRN
jgi:hypothetical protein